MTESSHASRRRTFDSLPPDHVVSAPRGNKFPKSHAAGAVQLPIKIYFRYGSHERFALYDGRPVDSASAHSQHTYAEAAIFHHDAQRNTIRLVVLKGRPQDVGCVYSSAAQAASCIRARPCSNEHCYLDLRGAQTLNQQRGFIERLVNCPLFADAAATCDTLSSLCLPHPQYLAFVEAHPHVGTRRDPVSIAQSNATSATSRVSGIVYRFPDLRLSAAEVARVAAVVEKAVCQLCPACITPVDARSLHTNTNVEATSDPAFVCSVCAQSYHFSCQHISEAEIDDGFDYTCIGCVADPDSLFSSSVAITRGRKAEAARAGKRNLKITSTGANLPEMAMHEGVDSQQESMYAFDLRSITELRSKGPSSSPLTNLVDLHHEEALPLSEDDMSDSEPLQTGDAQPGRSLRTNTNELRRAYHVAASLHLSIASNAPLESGILTDEDYPASAVADAGLAAAAVYPSFSRDCIPGTLMHHYRAPRAAPLVHLERVRFNLYDAPSSVSLLRPRPDATVAVRAAVLPVSQPESSEGDHVDPHQSPSRAPPPASVWNFDSVSIQHSLSPLPPPQAVDLPADVGLASETDSAPAKETDSPHGAVNLEELLRRVGAEAYAPLLRSQEIGATDLVFLSEDDWALFFPDCALGVRRLLQAVLMQEHMRVPTSDIYHRRVY